MLSSALFIIAVYYRIKVQNSTFKLYKAEVHLSSGWLKVYCIAGESAAGKQRSVIVSAVTSVPDHGSGRAGAPARGGGVTWRRAQSTGRHSAHYALASRVSPPPSLTRGKSRGRTCTGPACGQQFR